MIGEEERERRGHTSYLLQTWVRPTIVSVTRFLEQSKMRREQQQQQMGMQKIMTAFNPPPSSNLPCPLFTSFLSQHHILLLKRLMGQVDFAAVSHENICVLNSALLFFICAHQRGHLPTVVQRLHRIQERDFERLEREEGEGGREERVKLESRFFSWKAPLLPEGEEEERFHDTAAAGVAATAEGAEAAARGGGEGGKGDGRGHNTPVHIAFMRNFRALLFFWQVYYCPRGRDRYSLEFSTHLPFAVWKEVVDRLCEDEAASMTALVHTPLVLPLSPYVQAPAYPVHSRVRSRKL